MANDLKIELTVGSISPAMQKVKDIVDQDDDWTFAFCAISQGKTYVEYTHWLEANWQEYSPVIKNTFDLIACMYKSALAQK